MTREGVPPLDVFVGVDSLDTFMLTGLTLDIPGCSPPKCWLRLEPGSISYDACTL